MEPTQNTGYIWNLTSGFIHLSNSTHSSGS